MGTTNTDFAGLDPFSDYKTRDWGILSTDRTHIMNASWTWRLGAPIKEGALKFLVNDWNLSGISTFSSGQPFRPFFAGNQLGSDAMERAWYGTQDFLGAANQATGGAITPTYSCNPNLGTAAGLGEKIWDISCIGIPGFGESGPYYPTNTLRLPGKSFHDLTVFKDFGLGGSRRLQLRFGAFNIFNQAYADTISFQDVDTQLQTTCQQVSGIDNGNGGVSNNVCVPTGTFAYTSNTLANFGKIKTKRGHRSIEFAVRLFF